MGAVVAGRCRAVEQRRHGAALFRMRRDWFDRRAAMDRRDVRGGGMAGVGCLLAGRKVVRRFGNFPSWRELRKCLHTLGMYGVHHIPK